MLQLSEHIRTTEISIGNIHPNKARVQVSCLIPRVRNLKKVQPKSNVFKSAILEVHLARVALSF